MPRALASAAPVQTNQTDVDDGSSTTEPLPNRDNLEIKEEIEDEPATAHVDSHLVNGSVKEEEEATETVREGLANQAEPQHFRILLMPPSSTEGRLKDEEEESAETDLPLSQVLPPPTTYTCHLCQATYFSYHNLNTHRAYDHIEGVSGGPREAQARASLYPCTQCPRNFPCRSELYNHRRMHTGALPYVCSLCPQEKRYANSSRLRIHVKTHHPNEQWTPPKPFNCPTCSEPFSEEHHLEDHLLAHKREIEKKSQQAKGTTVTPQKPPPRRRGKGKKLKNKQAEMGKNEREMGKSQTEPSKPQIITVKQQRKASVLRKLEEKAIRKMKAAQEVKRPRPPQKTTIWPRAGPWETEVGPAPVLTVFSPTGAPVPCPLCPATSTPGALYRHLSIHLLGRPWRCPLCPSTFPHVGQLKLHRTRSHPGQELTDEALMVYQEQPGDSAQVSGELHCPLCPASSYVEARLQAHLEAHTVENPPTCEVCGIPFLLRISLEAHRKAVHSLPAETVASVPEEPSTVTCEHCPASFATKEVLGRHLKVHTMRHPFVCQLCDVHLAAKNALTTHLKRWCAKRMDSGSKRQASDDGEESRDDEETKKRRADVADGEVINAEEEDVNSGLNEELPVQICEKEDPTDLGPSKLEVSTFGV